MSDEQFSQALKWFEQLSTEFRAVREEVAEIRKDLKLGLAGLAEEVHELRDLLTDLQDDLRVQRRAFADHDRRLEALERTP